MNKILLLQDLHFSRDDVESRLRTATGHSRDVVWFDSPNLEEQRDRVEILITRNHEVTEAVLSEWPHLRMISLGFTGYDNVDLEYARSRGIAVYYVPGYATDSVAELNVALALSLLRKIPLADESIRQGAWDTRVSPGTELMRKKVGIIGTGTIGRATAQLFRAFGCSLIGWSRTEHPEFFQLGGKYLDRKTVFSEADIVVICLSLSDVTRNLIGRDELESLRGGAVLINTARSELVDQLALLDVLRRGKIVAGIDAFSNRTERGGLDELFALENVVLTPHLGFKTNEALERLSQETIQNVAYFLSGNQQNLVPKA